MLGDFRFTDTGRPGKQEGTFRLLRRFQPCPSQLDGGCQGFDRRILTEHHHLQIALKIAQQILVAGRDILRRNARNIGDHVFDVGHIDGLLALVFRLQPLPRTGFIDDINGLVGQVPVGDVPVRQFCSHPQGLVGVLEVVVFLEARLQALEDLVGILNAWLVDIDFLEPTRQCTVLLENSTELLERGRTNAAEFA